MYTLKEGNVNVHREAVVYITIIKTTRASFITSCGLQCEVNPLLMKKQAGVGLDKDLLYDYIAICIDWVFASTDITKAHLTRFLTMLSYT